MPEDKKQDPTQDMKKAEEKENLTLSFQQRLSMFQNMEKRENKENTK